MSAEVEDFLTADNPVPGQNYVVLSCIWPEKVLRRKELYLMKNFLKDTLSDPLQVKRILDKLELEQNLTYEEVEDMYESYCLGNATKIFKQFDEENDFQTSVRGIKVRGVYDTLKEARIRSEVLKRKDPNFETWVGQCGYWLPLEPQANDDEIEQVYSNPQLNKIFSKKQENMAERETVFDPMVKAEMEAKRKESELNTLVGEYNNKIDTQKTQFDEETQRKKDDAARETERRKAEQERQRQEMEAQNQTKKSKKSKKNKKNGHKLIKRTTASESSSSSTKESSEEPSNAISDRQTLISQLRDTAERINNLENSATVASSNQASESSSTESSSTEPSSTESSSTEQLAIRTTDAEDKIKQLRQILDERENVYQRVKDNQNQGDGPSLVTTTPAPISASDVNVNNNMMLSSDRGPDIFDGQHSDPWMQRKTDSEDIRLNSVLNKVL